MRHGYRTHTCGELRPEHIGQEVVLQGWVQTRRDLGGVIFVDLRDRYGITQIVFSPQDSPEAHALADRLRSEYVISVRGQVAARPPETINPRIPTGQIEVRVRDLEILSRAETPPFEIEDELRASEDLRLRYRYLDLRRPRMQRMLGIRHEAALITRLYFSQRGFWEIETPMLTKSTPEGARDYLVPSRLHPGKFYALPQSPQLYKQLLMLAGMDRYFQIVRCFRDEDLRADRQPEFTQIDVEMSFATRELIWELIEGLMAELWSRIRGQELARPFPRLTYEEAIRRYGSDKPDLRPGMPIVDLSAIALESPFRLFRQTVESGGKVAGIAVPGGAALGRAYMDRLTEYVRRELGAGGLVYIRHLSDGGVQCSVKTEVLPEDFVRRMVQAMALHPGDLGLLLAGPVPHLYRQLGALRLHMAQACELYPRQETYAFLWVVDFPLLEWDEEERRWVAVHHPFTAPHPEDEPLLESDPVRVRAQAYDLVLNGYELGGGSIRIHSPELQRRLFRLLGIPDEEAERKFGFLLQAFRYGAPPHGGIALGFDRLVMLLTGASNLREVIAFPKTQSAQELMIGSPDVVDPRQLEELHIRTVLPRTQTVGP
jgi:aspartyl-tRNA synthetase|nr:MAG: aspartate--tRNA(Asp/Asn) ligase [Bacteroidota bacterium]